MYSIRQIAEAVERTTPDQHMSSEEKAAFDAERAEYVTKLDKALRNLSQRVYLPAAQRIGRVDLYDRPGVAAFALVIALHDFDVPRHVLQAFAKWAQEPGGPAFAKVGNRHATPVEEAILRLDAGEDFTFEIVGGAFGRKIFRARWAEDEAHYAEQDSISPRPTLRLPSSKLIEILLNGLAD